MVRSRCSWSCRERSRSTHRFEAIAHRPNIDDLTYKKIKDHDPAIGVIEWSFAQETSS
jgi:hypothetical protein